MNRVIIFSLALMALISGIFGADARGKDKEMDWSEFFGDASGSAVFYDSDSRVYYTYGGGKVDRRYSPCSTFKIISSLLGWEKGIITRENPVRTWCGKRFWKKEWNRDIEFSEAFKVSCIWYFREVIDQLGPSFIREELAKLGYGNCDVSDWDGRMNTNEPDRILKGFWVESSLLVSPREQVDALQKIFGDQSVYRKADRDAVQEAMLIEQSDCPAPIYGKTGLGKKGKEFADAWFVGFICRGQGRGPVYFAVHLDSSSQPNTASIQAKGIATRLAASLLEGK